MGEAKAMCVVRIYGAVCGGNLIWYTVVYIVYGDGVYNRPKYRLQRKL